MIELFQAAVPMSVHITETSNQMLASCKLLEVVYSIPHISLSYEAADNLSNLR